MSEPSLSVTQALAVVMGKLPGVKKGDRSPEGYQYRGIESITKELQPLLSEHGIVFVPRATIVQTVPSPAMKDGWQDVYLRVEWTIFGPDGSHIVAVTNGIGRDRSDKGANKAQTQAFKYLLLHLLCVADTADDSDGVTYDADRSGLPTRDINEENIDAGMAAALTDALASIHDPTERAHVKQDFVREFGTVPSLVALSRGDAAARWVSERVAAATPAPAKKAKAVKKAAVEPGPAEPLTPAAEALTDAVDGEK
jgi:hypothetical protein